MTRTIKENAKLSAEKYVERLEKLVATQEAIMQLCEKEVVSENVWEIIGEKIITKHGEEAYNAAPIIFLALDIFMYTINKLEDNEFYDAVNRLYECVKELKENTDQQAKENSGGWIH